ncbi:MAG: hypothetical protein PUJ61_10210 [Spirochaetia bacterium]|nr:hypothetical protein [Spirochaetia bacterium]
MLFTSLNFLIFLAVVSGIHYLLPGRFRVPFLLLASYLFYGMLQPAFTLLLGCVTLIGYFGAIGLEEMPREKARGTLLAIIAVISVGILLYFKYYDFIVFNLNTVFNLTGIPYVIKEKHWLQPIGISFFTFQTLGYVLDVYKRKYVAERSLVYLALFVAFFPVILSGPIERGEHLLPQLRQGTKFNWDGLVCGIKTMLCGYFLKLVIAERIFVYLGWFFDAPRHCSSVTLLLGMLLYPIGIYADFAGYSLTAVGVAKVLGYDVNSNFERPFMADSIPAFWRRWHISLTSWMTDYVHTPLTILLRDYGILGIAVASFTVFLLVGIWHGASWNYIIFGCIHGLYVAISVLKQKHLKKFEKKYKLKGNMCYRVVNRIETYMLVSIAFVLFRTPSLAKAGEFYQRLLMGTRGLNYGVSSLQFVLMLFFAFALLTVESVQEKWSIKFLNNTNLVIRWGCCIVLCLFLLLFGNFGGSSFVYLQF